MVEAARTTAQRAADTRQLLSATVDLWAATASTAGDVHLVPLSFAWSDDRIIFCTDASSPTGRNLATGGARLAVGGVRDVVMIDAELERTAPLDDADTLAAFVGTLGFDPSDWGEQHAFFVLRPTRIQAWRESNEIAGRTILRDGAWLT